MKNRLIYFITGCFLLLAASTGIACKQRHSDQPGYKSPEVVKTYRCPNKCSQQVFHKPGKCPICSMELESEDAS